MRYKNYCIKKYNRFSYICILLCSIILSTYFGFCIISYQNSVFAANYWSDYKTSVTEEDGEYKIYTPQQLSYMFFTKIPNASSSSTIKISLQKDLDMSDHLWGTSTCNCNLVLNGNNRSIYGLKNTGTKVGFIAESSSGSITIKNLGVFVDFNTSGTSAIIGGFVGKKSGGSLTFENCFAYGSIYANAASACVGGFVGDVLSFTATSCQNNVELTSSKFCNATYAGGFAGNVGSSCKLTLCRNSGEVNGYFRYVGGFVGYCKGIDLNNSRSYNCANLTSLYKFLDKTNNDNPTPLPKLAVSAVDASLPELSLNYITGCVGGLVGYVLSATNSTISYVYNTGKVTSNGVAGGLVGNSSVKLKFSNVYVSGDVGATENLVSNITNGSTYCNLNDYVGTYFVEKSSKKKYNIKVTGCTTQYRGKKSRDVSIIGDDSKVSERTKCYSKRPSCTISGGIRDNKHTFSVSLYNNGSVVTTISASTSFVRSCSSNMTSSPVLSYSDENYDEFFDKYYYSDFKFPSTYTYTLNTQQYIENRGDSGYIGTYLFDTNALYLYTILCNSDYKKNGLPSYYDSKISTMKSKFGIRNLKLSGVRIYLCRWNYDFSYDDDLQSNYNYDIRIYPLITMECEYGGSYYGTINVPFMQGFDYEIYHDTYDFIRNISTSSVSYSSEYALKNSITFDGDAFTRYSDYNGGYPVFKDMYWGL